MAKEVQKGVAYMLVLTLSLLGCDDAPPEVLSVGNVSVCDKGLWVEFLGKNSVNLNDSVDASLISRELYGNYEFFSEAYYNSPPRPTCMDLAEFNGKKIPMIRMIDEEKRREVEAFFIEVSPGTTFIQLRGTYLK